MSDEYCVKESLDSTPKRWTYFGCGGCFWAAVGVLLVLFFIAMLLPVVVPHREVAQRITCSNNLHKIMVAMFNYYEKYGAYPPAYTVDKQSRRMHSWRALILEFLDRDLYKRYDFSRPWNCKDNLDVANMMKEKGPYCCPSEQPQNPLNTSYVMLVGPQAFSPGPTGQKMEEITDGPAYTLAVVEMSPSGICWTAPYDLNVSEMSYKINDPDQVGIRSCHSGGANVLFADGHTQFLYNVDEKTLKALCTINGKEDLGDFQ